MPSNSHRLPRKRVTFAQKLVPTSIQPGYRVGWFEVLGRVEQKTNKRSGKSSKFWYRVRCTDCGQQFLKTRGELNYVANYYPGNRRCQHAGRERVKLPRLITALLSKGRTLPELAAIASLVEAVADLNVVGDQYDLSPEACRRIAAELPPNVLADAARSMKKSVPVSDVELEPVIVEMPDGETQPQAEDPKGEWLDGEWVEWTDEPQ